MSARDPFLVTNADYRLQELAAYADAQRALDAGQMDAARDLLIEAGRELAENAVAAWERVR